MQMALFERPVLFADFAAHWMSRYSSPPWVTAYTAYIRAGHLRANVLPAIGHLALADIQAGSWRGLGCRPSTPTRTRRPRWTGSSTGSAGRAELLPVSGRSFRPGRKPQKAA